MILVGCTGFVGSNLIENGCFDKVYHSTDVYNAYGSKPDIMIYAGVTGTKFWANRFPENDQKIIDQAKINISKIGAKKIILISSVDVNQSLSADENYKISKSLFGVYGNNRLNLEQWVQDNFEDYHIIRLPALYGKNLKKNYIHDLIFPVPPMLTEVDYNNVLKKIPEICDAYKLDGDEFYHLDLNYTEMKRLEVKFLNNSFNALSFTDPRSSFQYYNLSWLWNDINKIIKSGIRRINLVTEPIYADELFRIIYKQNFMYKVVASKINYNLKTIYAKLFEGKEGYAYSKKYVLNDLSRFIIENKKY